MPTYTFRMSRQWHEGNPSRTDDSSNRRDQMDMSKGTVCTALRRARDLYLCPLYLCICGGTKHLPRPCHTACPTCKTLALWGLVKCLSRQCQRAGRPAALPGGHEPYCTCSVDGRGRHRRGMGPPELRLPRLAQQPPRCAPQPCPGWPVALCCTSSHTYMQRPAPTRRGRHRSRCERLHVLTLHHQSCVPQAIRVQSLTQYADLTAAAVQLARPVPAPLYLSPILMSS